MHKDTIKLFQMYLRPKEVGKIAYHGEILQAKTTKTFPSLDLALGLVLATNGPRFHASPTWFQSTSSQGNRAPERACSKSTFPEHLSHLRHFCL